MAYGDENTLSVARPSPIRPSDLRFNFHREFAFIRSSSRFLPLFPVVFCFGSCTSGRRDLCFSSQNQDCKTKLLDYASNAFSESSRHDTFSPGFSRLAALRFPFALHSW